MKDLQVDRDRAIKVAAMAGLALLAITVLPGLLHTPDPPKLPSDVGFLPSEIRSTPSISNSDRASAKPREPREKDRKRTGYRRRRGERANRGKVKRNSSRNHSEHAVKRLPKAKSRAESPVSTPVPTPAVQAPADPPSPAPPTVSAPSPTPSSPPVRSPVAPGDGSQEFAPR